LRTVKLCRAVVLFNAGEVCFELGPGGPKMVSAWWLVAAFMCGGGAGLLLASLMYFSEGMPSHSTIPDANAELDINLRQW